VKHVDHVRWLSKDILGSRRVELVDDIIDQVAERIQNEFQPFKLMGPPKVQRQGVEVKLNESETFQYELWASAVNYCYWYGRDQLRPGGGGASEMYHILNLTFAHGAKEFGRSLISARFPLCEQRSRHLSEAYSFGSTEYGVTINHSLHFAIREFIKALPGFAGDMFLKRTFLFFMMLHRRFGYWADEIHELPVPADYRVPQSLRHLGCLIYDHDLATKVDNEIHIPSGSMEELSIRAATIIACDRLSSISGVPLCQIDDWLWSTRFPDCKPFHLTVTTDY